MHRLERDRLWLDYRPLVSKLLRQWGTDSDREDLRNDLFVRFSDLLDTYDDSRGVPIQGYIVRMLELFCYTRWRKLRKVGKREVLFSQLSPDYTDLLGEDPTPEWDARIQKEAVIARLRPAIVSLSPGRRQAITLRYLEDLPYSEVAARMGVVEGTARSQVRFGIRDLRRAFL